MEMKQEAEQKKAEEAQKKAEEEEKARVAAEKERERRRTDTNYNPLLKNGITNRDVSLLLSNYFADLPRVRLRQ